MNDGSNNVRKINCTNEIVELDVVKDQERNVDDNNKLFLMDFFLLFC